MKDVKKPAQHSITKGDTKSGSLVSKTLFNTILMKWGYIARELLPPLQSVLLQNSS